MRGRRWLPNSEPKQKFDKQDKITTGLAGEIKAHEVSPADAKKMAITTSCLEIKSMVALRETSKFLSKSYLSDKMNGNWNLQAKSCTLHRECPQTHNSCLSFLHICAVWVCFTAIFDEWTSFLCKHLSKFSSFNLHVFLKSNWAVIFSSSRWANHPDACNASSAKLTSWIQIQLCSNSITRGPTVPLYSTRNKHWKNWNFPRVYCVCSFWFDVNWRSSAGFEKRTGRTNRFCETCADPKCKILFAHANDLTKSWQ